MTDPVLVMLPPARPRHRGHGHEEDPYESLPGAAIPRGKPVVEPIARDLTPAEKEARGELAQEQAAITNRYATYLELLGAGVSQVEALASVFQITTDMAREQRFELQAEVRRGMGSVGLAEQLERHDLSSEARVALLRKHAYSNVPAASLKALDMLSEMDGDGADVGSFESYLRVVKGQTR